MKFLSAVHNTTLPCSQSQSFCLFLHALLYEISENSDTDRFHSISHCKLNYVHFLRKKYKQTKQNKKTNKKKQWKFNSITIKTTCIV